VIRENSLCSIRRNLVAIAREQWTRSYGAAIVAFPHRLV